MTGDKLIRWAAAVATAVVAAIAAVISYGHAYEVAVAYGESGATARALPLTVDGLIVTCSLVLLDAARRRSRAPLLAWLLLAAGIAATVGANVAHGLDHGIVGAVIAGWPALVAVGSFELLARLIREHRPAAVTETMVSASAGPVTTVTVDGCPPEVAEGVADVNAPAAEDERHPEGDSDGGSTIVETSAIADSDPTATGGLFPAPTDPAIAALVATARDRYAELLATGRRPSVRALRRDLRVGHPRAAAVRDALGDGSTP